MSTDCCKLYDLHNHLLFALDDGAKDSAETAAMLEDAARNNINVIVATPHAGATVDLAVWQERLNICSEMADQYGIKLLPGAEYNARHFPDAPPYLTLGGVKKGFVLMDFRLPSLPPEFTQCLDDIYNADHQLIIAHPERSFPESTFFELEKLVDAGVVFQLTAGSILGAYGRKIRSISWMMLEKNWAKLIASDAHDVLDRKNCLAAAYEAIEHHFGAAAAGVLKENAARVVEAPGDNLQKIPCRRKLFGWLGC